VGYAAVFNSDSQPLRAGARGQFVERIAPGAFARSLAALDVRGLYNHRDDYVLGRKSAGTLRLAEDDKGLRYEIDAPDTSYARDLMESIRRGDVTGSSFSFATVADDWSDGPDGMPIRTLKDVHVFDVGPVTFPAYADTSAACRSLDRHREAGDAAADSPEAPDPGTARPAADAAAAAAAATRQRLLKLRLAALQLAPGGDDRDAVPPSP
jgi:hypothetical protein